MATALRDTRIGRGARSKEEYLEAGREYVRRYGESELTASAFNPASAKRNGRPDLVDRYYAGREDGTVWPSLNAIKRNFNGSFNEYRRALGLKPNKIGGLHRRKVGEAEPILYVRERRVVTESGANKTWLERQLAKERRRADRLAEELDAEKAKSIEQNPRVVELRNRLAETTHRYKDVKRELHNSVRREARARASAERSDRRGHASALREVDRLTQRLIEAQDEVLELRSAPKSNTRTKTVSRTVKVQDEKLLRQVEKLETQVTDLRHALHVSEESRNEALERLASVRQGSMRDALESQKVRTAERRVAELERELVAYTEVLVGERRLLNVDELEKLRNDGPAGPSIFKDAVIKVARAEGSVERKEALWNAIAVARNWIDRL